MFHPQAPVLFVDQIGLDQFFGMFRDRLEISLCGFGQFVQADAGMLGDQKQKFDPAMVSNALEVTFKLLWSFGASFFHKKVGLNLSVKTSVCKTSYHIQQTIPIFCRIPE